MKRYKRILALLAVLAVACAATFAVSRYEEYQEQIAVSGETILAVDPDTATALSWTVDGESLAFHKDEGWLYDDDAAFPVDAEKIGEKLDLFADFAVAFTIENVEDYAQYGLDDPAGAITLTAGEQSYEIKLGDFSQMDEQRYIDIGDGNVYLAVSDPMDSFGTELSEMILDDTVPAFDTVSRIAFAGAENYEIHYDETGSGSYAAEDVYFDASGRPLDTSLVEGYLADLSAADLSTYATYNASADELEAMGMNDPELTVTVDYTDTDADGEEVSGTFTASIARAPDDRATLETAAADEESGDTAEDTADDITAYLRVGESQIVYELPGADFTALMAASYNDLRHQQLFWGDWEDVTAIDATLEGETHTLTAKGSGDDRTWSYNGEEVDAADVTDALTALTAEEFTGEPADGQEEISLTLHLDNEDFPTVTLRLTRYDGARCLAEVDGESVALVPRADAMALVEAVQAIVLGQQA